MDLIYRGISMRYF